MINRLPQIKHCLKLIQNLSDRIIDMELDHKIGQ